MCVYIYSGWRPSPPNGWSGRPCTPSRQSGINNCEDARPHRTKLVWDEPEPNSSAVSDRQRSMRSIPPCGVGLWDCVSLEDSVKKSKFWGLRHQHQVLDYRLRFGARLVVRSRLGEAHETKAQLTPLRRFPTCGEQSRNLQNALEEKPTRGYRVHFEPRTLGTMSRNKFTKTQFCKTTIFKQFC